MKPDEIRRDSSSFRDPSGFVFYRDGALFRQINRSYQPDYEMLMSSGLYDELARDGLLIPHEEAGDLPFQSENGYKIIRPEPVRFISYPYEWCFSQLKDAALLTLEVQRRALARDMVLKDASAYNIQFRGGRPVLIDTLSFARYAPGEPWVAYRQFCQHFLAPLALMAYRDARLNKLPQAFIDGVPIDLASRLLPKGLGVRFGITTHIHLHALSQKVATDRGREPAVKKTTIAKSSLAALCENLCAVVSRLDWQPSKTAWAEYYQFTNYSEPSFDFKVQFVKEAVEQLRPDLVWDLGANTGLFSKRCVQDENCLVISSDYDPGAVEINYLDCKKEGIPHVHPLVIDLTNPSPAIGWGNRERVSFMERGPADMVFALALVHHLTISNNLPLEKIRDFFASVGRDLVVEFVPKEDSQVRRLLATREDIFTDYTLENFLQVFSEKYALERQERIPGSERVICLMRGK
jgi:hypothetical protein